MSLVIQVHGVESVRVTPESKHNDAAENPWFCTRTIEFIGQDGEVIHAVKLFGNPEGFDVIDQKNPPEPVCWHCHKPIEAGTAHHSQNDLHADCVADMVEGEKAHAEPPVFHRSEFE